MKYGAMNNPHNKLVDEIKLFSKYKLDYLDLTLEATKAHPEKILGRKKEVLDLLSTLDLKLLSGHFPWYMSIAHVYPRIREAHLEECVKVIEAASEYGIPKLTIHPDIKPHYHKKQKNEVIDATVESIKKLVKESIDHGITLSIENCFETVFEEEGFNVLFNKVPELMMTLDIGHANNTGKNGENIHQLMKDYSDRIVHAHAHDNKGVEDEHLPIGAGLVDWRKVGKSLKKIGYGDTVTLEIHSQDRDYIKISRDKLNEYLR